jgi:hypothetical protein
MEIISHVFRRKNTQSCITGGKNVFVEIITLLVKKNTFPLEKMA